MKRIIVISMAVCAVLFAGSATASAQVRYGVIGGMNFSTANVGHLSKGTMNKWHAGLTCKFDLPFGFSLQPSLLYTVKGARTAPDDVEVSKFDVTMGYLEVPVSVQWGPDLLLFRPFVDVTPYVGYALYNNMVTSKGKYSSWDNLNRFEGGLGLGIGLDIWRFQVIGRYNWNFGSLYKDGAGTGAELLGNVFSGKNFGGLSLSASFLFGGGKNKGKK